MIDLRLHVCFNSWSSVQTWLGEVGLPVTDSLRKERRGENIHRVQTQIVVRRLKTHPHRHRDVVLPGQL